jgi:hypothetical protein
MRCHGGIVGVRSEADKRRQQLLTAVTPGYRSAPGAQRWRGWASSRRSDSQRPACHW